MRSIKGVFRVCVVLLVSGVCPAMAYDTDIVYPSGPPTEPGALIGYEKVAEMSKGDVVSALIKNEIPTGAAQYDVTLYRIVYSSVFRGQPVALSGLVVVPVTQGALPHFQYHHGTLMPFPAEEGEGALDAPSTYAGGGPKKMANQYETMMFGLLPASAGYMVSLPDYIGYGVSKDVEHPYTYHPALGRQSAHMALAARELAQRLGLALEDGVFLGGWSEGGGAALAAHKELEANFADRLPVIASAPFAGPYHITRFFNYVVASTDGLDAFFIYNWSLYVHAGFADPKPASSDLWTYPVTKQTEALDVPSTVPSDVYTPGLIAAIAAQDDSPVIQAFRSGDIHTGWTPKGKVFLHSGKDDVTVPHFNSVDAYEGLKAAGGDVKLYEWDGDHYDPVGDYLQTMFEDFAVLRP